LAIRLSVQAGQVFILETKEISHMSNHAQHGGLQHQIAHAIHVAHSSESGRKVIHGVGHTVLATGTVLLAPVVGTALAPFVTVGALGYGLWKLLKN
jgi:hypothetical protein